MKNAFTSDQGKNMFTCRNLLVLNIFMSKKCFHAWITCSGQKNVFASKEKNMLEIFASKYWNTMWIMPGERFLGPPCDLSAFQRDDNALVWQGKSTSMEWTEQQVKKRYGFSYILMSYAHQVRTVRLREWNNAPVIIHHLNNGITDVTNIKVIHNYYESGNSWEFFS